MSKKSSNTVTIYLKDGTKTTTKGECNSKKDITINEELQWVMSATLRELKRQNISTSYVDSINIEIKFKEAQE